MKTLAFEDLRAPSGERLIADLNEEVAITLDGRTVAHLVPAPSPETLAILQAFERLRESTKPGPSVFDLLRETRDE